MTNLPKNSKQEYNDLKEIEIEIEKIEKSKLSLDEQSDYNKYLLNEFEGIIKPLAPVEFDEIF